MTKPTKIYIEVHEQDTNGILASDWDLPEAITAQDVLSLLKVERTPEYAVKEWDLMQKPKISITVETDDGSTYAEWE